MKAPADPNELRKLPRLLRALTWRLPIEYGEWMGKLDKNPLDKHFDRSKLTAQYADRGNALDETAVTTRQQQLLLLALKHTESKADAVAEIGAWRGITTKVLAENTRRKIFAVDPHKESEFPGINEAYQAFCQRTLPFLNIVHLRYSSGDAARQLGTTPLSMVFVDAIHDYLNTWYDFAVWGNLLLPGGLIALHDVDDHPGTKLVAKRILKVPTFRPWGYCPNLLVLERVG